ncbi:MAG: hypothetical protein AAB582_01780 [Patescibacteria group bacterium]
MRSVGRNDPFFTVGEDVPLERLPPANPYLLLQAYVGFSGSLDDASLAQDAMSIFSTETSVPPGEVLVSPDLLEITAHERMLAYLSLPPVTFMTIDILRWFPIPLPLLLDQLQQAKYPATIRPLDYIHILRIFELMKKYRTSGHDTPLRRGVKGRNIFAFSDYAGELMHTADESVHTTDLTARTWTLKPHKWETFAYKKGDRVFFVKEEHVAP